jgi:hypothetical protein
MPAALHQNWRRGEIIRCGEPVISKNFRQNNTNRSQSCAVEMPQPVQLVAMWSLLVLGSVSSWYGVIRFGLWLISKL